MLNHQEEYKKMSELESVHWWYRSLHELVMQAIEKFVVRKNPVIIDAGCGSGGLLQFLQLHGYQNCSGFDVSDLAVTLSNSKGLKVVKGDIMNIGQLFEKESADIIIINDVLYFFDSEKQQSIAQALHQLLRKDGILILNLPAMKIFKGQHDQHVGIHRRFEKSDIANIFHPSQFQILKLNFWPFLLSPIIFLTRFKQRIFQGNSGDSNGKSDLKQEPALINSFCYHLTSFENKYLKYKPMGSSIFLVLKKLNSL